MRLSYMILGALATVALAAPPTSRSVRHWLNLSLWPRPTRLPSVAPIEMRDLNPVFLLCEKFLSTSDSSLGTEYGKRDRNGTEYGKRGRNGTEYGKRDRNGTEYDKRDRNGTEYGKRDRNGTEYGKRDMNGTEYSKREPVEESA
ncbi:hypothetical protein SCUP515_03849 [Seiridium cupressi]